MTRSKLLLASIPGALILSIAQFASAMTTQTRIDYTAAIERASAVYKDASAKCKLLTGHDKAMCAVEARAVQKRAKASAWANYEGTIKSKTGSLIADADADFMVAKVACDNKAGRGKDVCIKQANATHTKLVADAKANNTSAR